MKKFLLGLLLGIIPFVVSLAMIFGDVALTTISTLGLSLETAVLSFWYAYPAAIIVGPLLLLLIPVGFYYLGKRSK